MNPSDSTSSPAAVQPEGSDSYRPDLVEAKWQARWTERHTNEPDLDGARKPFYNLMMFPYPSAEGLHVGNLFAFTGNDIYRTIPAAAGAHASSSRSATTRSASTRENYALKVGVQPGGADPAEHRELPPPAQARRG